MSAIGHYSCGLIEGNDKMNHKLKTWTAPFQAMWEGRKLFEFRKNDRDFKIGDWLTLQEWNPGTEYTGREMNARVTWILTEGFGLPWGYCIMSLRLGLRTDRGDGKP
jgi:hypothetical protein